jgi:dihydrofolate reductase
MRTQYFTASSLDGFIADPQHSLEWLLQFGQEDPSYTAFIEHVGALVMGAHTYEWIWRHHCAPDAPHPMAWPYTQPAWVFTSRQLPEIPGADIRFVSGAVAPVHAAMRQAAGLQNIWIVGGGDLAGQFHDAGLLDELIVTITSVTLGEGQPLLPRRIASPPLVLEQVTQTGEAFVQLRYRVPVSERRPSSH